MIAGIMAAVVALDGIVVAVWFAPALGVVLAVIGAGTSVVCFRRVPAAADRDSDWSLGTGFDISDPAQAKKQPARFSLKTILQGILCIGQSGSGKTESFALGFIHYVRRLGYAMAYFDGKGDIDIIQKYTSLVGAPDYLFSTELEHSHTLNLLAGKPADVVDRLVPVLIGSTTSTTYYADNQYAALSRVVPVLLSLDEPANLRDLYVVLALEDAGRDMLRRAKSCGADPEQIELAAHWYDSDAGERFRNISGMLTRMFPYVAGPTSDRLNAYNPDIDISRAVNAGENLYFHLPYTHYSVAVSQAIQEMFAVEARRRQLAGGSDAHFYPLLFDDWGKFVYDGFSPFMARCRSAKMPASFSFQSVGQLREVGRNFLDEIDDLAATKVFLRVQGAATAHYAAGVFGEAEAIDISVSQSRHHQSNNLHTRAAARVSEDDLRHLTDGEAFVSTPIKGDDSHHHALWRVRFPYLAAGLAPLPTIDTVRSDTGLNFWTRYLNPKGLQALQSQAREQADKKQTEQGDAVALAAAELIDNPGFVLTEDEA